MSNLVEKQFSIGMVVSCKRLECEANGDACASCIENFIGEDVKKHTNFSLSQVTTSNGSKQFVVSFNAHCRKPDCTASTPQAVSCCTASSDKCELCLRTIVGRSIQEMYGFHAKEIVIA